MRFKNKIGVLGGSFDPAHIGHLAISKKAVKKYKLKKIIWAITLKNPLKKKNNTSISQRIQSCKKIIKLNNFIKIKFYEKVIRSNKTIDLINFLKRTTKAEIYFLMGADNLINFHKWYKWEAISKKCKIIVFDIIETLDINKAQDIVSIDLKDKSSMADYMIIASGTSSRHIQALSEQVLEKLKDNGIKNSKIEGKDSNEWKLVDGIDLIIHIFHPEKRKFYELEKMWSELIPNEKLII